MTSVAVVGTGPATDALTDSFSAADIDVERPAEPKPGDAELLVVVDRAGASTFETADRAEIPWVAVELGGIGGLPIVEAAVTGFSPDSGCYDCLRRRVRSTTPEADGAVERPGAEPERFAGSVAGHHVAESVRTDTPLAGQIVELPYTEREFLPVPGCDCDPGREWAFPDGDPTQQVDAAVSAERGLDERVGIVTEVGEAESFPAPYYLTTICDTGGFSDVSAPQQAAGVAADWDTAFMKAMGESYERYAAGIYRTAKLPGQPPAEPVGPETFVRPASHTDEPPVAWVPGEALETGEHRALPAETVCYPPPSDRVRPATTTGLGLGQSITDALLSGLYEIVERDAAVLAWYSTYDPLGLAIDDHEGYATLRRRARSEGLSVTPLLLTQDVDVPVVAVAVEGEAWPSFALGMAADLDPAEAAVGALAEALQNWMELRGMGRTEAQSADGAIGRYADRPRSVQSLTDPETTVPVGSLGPDRIGDGEAELSALLDRVGAAGIDAYGVRLTTRDLASMGFEAVRVVCPSAQPLFFRDAYFGERARTVPGSLGFEPRLDRAHHPYP